jgi:hypothetical protein
VFANNPPEPRSKDDVEVRYRDEPYVEFDGAEGLAIDDRVIVFAEAYDGGYGIVPKNGTGITVGIRVLQWDDPIVGALQRWLAGTADLRKPADADPWRKYGEIAIGCALDGTPVMHCGMD